MRQKATPWPLVIILGGFLAMFLLTEYVETEPGPPVPGGGLAPGELRPGETAPPFEAVTLSGETIRFPEDYRGKQVLLDFWATWCPPCRAEIPHIKRAEARFRKDGLVILGINLDGERGMDAEGVRRFVAREGMRWPQVYAGAETVAARYRIRALPAALLVEADSGRIVAVGESLRGTRLEETLARHLGRSSP